MNNLKNSVRLLGRVGIEPEVMNFDNGKKKIRFSLATSDYYKDADGKRIEDTQWHNIVAWGGQAAILEKFLHKGKEIAVEGKLTHRSYVDKDGQRRYITEVIVSEALFIGAPQAEKAGT
jgi:single-strand DNA-binding protein